MALEPERIALQRAVAFVGADRIAIRPSRAALVGAVIELGIAGLAIAAIVFLFHWLPLFVLMVLLILAILLGPLGVLGIIYGAAGTAFLMERNARAARWQQGFLGMGIGTTDYCPFDRIARFEVAGDELASLPSGERQDVVQWDVRLVKDNEKELTVGSVVAARSLADLGVERANYLAQALADMAGVPVTLAESIVSEPAVEAAPAPRRRFRRVGGAPREGE
jgi:hypothetical protein